MLDFINKRRWFLLASFILIIIGLISVLIPGGLKMGMDFKGGMSVTLVPKEGETLTLAQVKQKLTDLGFSQAAGGVQQLGTEETREFFIRTPSLTDAEQEKLKNGLADIGQVKDFMVVSSLIASETARNAAIAVGVAIVAMLIYMVWAFRKMPSPIRYGTCAIIALLFNVLMVLGVFSFLGRTLGWEIDPMFITAILAVVGYSINDTIVVLDRVRENVTRLVSSDFGTTVNYAITGTIARSLNTSITTVLAVLAVYLFVGGPISHFLMALFIGIVAGTYSSIFIASQLLVVWERREWGSFLPKIPQLQRSKE